MFVWGAVLTLFAVARLMGRRIHLSVSIRYFRVALGPYIQPIGPDSVEGGESSNLVFIDCPLQQQMLQVRLCCGHGMDQAMTR